MTYNTRFTRVLMHLGRTVPTHANAVDHLIARISEACK